MTGTPPRPQPQAGSFPAAGSLKIVLAGHHPVVRQSLREIIERERDLVVVAEARDIQEALVAARALQPDVVILDATLARDKGVAALRQVCPAERRARIVMVGISADREHVIHALRAGACAYLRTQDAAEELVTALRTASQERLFLGAAVEKEEIMAHMSAVRTKRRVLVVEDDVDFVEIVKTTLERGQYEVLVANNKEDGLRMLRSERPDAVILDVMMPEETEGFHFVWELRQDRDEQLRNTPILVLTSIHQQTPLPFCPDEGDGTYGPYEYLPVQDFADKPLEPDRLLEKVGRLLSNHVGERKQP